MVALVVGDDLYPFPPAAEGQPHLGVFPDRVCLILLEFGPEDIEDPNLVLGSERRFSTAGRMTAFVVIAGRFTERFEPDHMAGKPLERDVTRGGVVFVCNGDMSF